MEKKYTEYKTDRETCQSMIDLNGNVCDGCGGIIEPLETVDNAGDPTFWSGCNHCNVFTSGVKQEVYLTAKDMVLEQGYISYRHMDRITDKSSLEYIEYFNESQIRGTCSLIRQVLHTYKKFT